MGVRKIIRRMLAGAKDIRVDELETVAKRFGLQFGPGGKHQMKIKRPGFRTVPIPDHEPVDPHYVEQVLDLVFNLIPSEWRRLK